MAERGLIATGQENVLIQAGACSVTVLPHLGGKIASIVANGHELLQAPLVRPAPRTQTMSFDAGDASGWDECLPSVAECDVPVAGGSAHVPDHGDLWRVAWEKKGTGNGAQGSGDQSVALRGECFSLPLALDRSLTLNERKGGWRLDLDYRLTNTGTTPVPWSWAAHPLFVAAPGDRIVLPESIRTLRLEGSGGERLGKGGATVEWPIAKLASGGQTDLSVAKAPDSGIGDKLFAGPLTAAENWCALERPSARLRIKVSFDSSVTPYLGLWICYGGWPDGPGPKQVCVALEPATAPVDSLAKTGAWSRTLNPGQSSSWTMHVDLEVM
jgi:galactose mutarotase-like enzyme